MRSYKQVSDRAADMLTINWQYAKNWKKESEKTREGYEPPEDLSSIAEIHFVIKEEGIYKIKYEDLRDSLQVLKDKHEIDYLFDIDSIDRYIELLTRMDLCQLTQANDGSFDEGDFFEFYDTMSVRLVIMIIIAQRIAIPLSFWIAWVHVCS